MLFLWADWARQVLESFVLPPSHLLLLFLHRDVRSTVGCLVSLTPLLHFIGPLNTLGSFKRINICQFAKIVSLSVVLETH